MSASASPFRLTKPSSSASLSLQEGSPPSPVSASSPPSPTPTLIVSAAAFPRIVRNTGSSARANPAPPPGPPGGAGLRAPAALVDDQRVRGGRREAEVADRVDPDRLDRAHVHR